MAPFFYNCPMPGNYYESDALLQELAAKRLDKAALERLSEAGAAAAGPLAALIEASHRDANLPYLRKYDRWGGRVDEVVYCPEQLQARRLSMSLGLLPPIPLHERMLKTYLLNQNGEGGVTCPLIMTDGLIQLLEENGTPAQKKRWLARLSDPAWGPALAAGQFVTEKQGGSSVSENETRAALQKDGSWKLTGLKWFCSNPGGLWVTTAKPEGSDVVGLFLMARDNEDGSLNDCHILRLKDLSGTRGKATAEVEYRGARAELIGRASHGLALLLRTVLRASRLGVAAASAGFIRRALVEAETYAQERLVQGRPAAELPAVKKELGALREAHRVALLAFVDELDALEKDDPAADVLVPLLKIQLSRLATDSVRRARLILAGNGALRDFSILPRLAEDALIQEIWEGTHPVLAGHVARALKRPASRKAFEARYGRPAALDEDAAWAAMRDTFTTSRASN